MPPAREQNPAPEALSGRAATSFILTYCHHVTFAGKPYTLRLQGISAALADAQSPVATRIGWREPRFDTGR